MSRLSHHRLLCHSMALGIVAGALAGANIVADAEDAPASAMQPGGSLDILFENDSLFSRSDRHYTHGTLISYTSPTFTAMDQTGDPSLPHAAARRLADLMPLFSHEGTLRYRLDLGQNIYTPSDITAATPDPTDRPYAGWLYGGLGLIEDRRVDEQFSILNNFELQLGVVGPASLAEQVQKTWHSLIGARHPNGWSHQLKNEPGVVVYYERKWRFEQPLGDSGLSVDAIPDASVSLGNIFTYAGAGGMVRFGQALADDYGPPRISPSLHGSEYFDPARRFGWYLFAGVEGRAVARNIFLDGNTFADSPSVDKLPLVGDAEIGAALVYRHIRVSYTYVLRSDEFRGQKAADHFGSLSFAYRFAF